MRWAPSLLLLFAAACGGGPTAPAKSAHDPVVLWHNLSAPPEPDVIMLWSDRSGQVSRTVMRAGTTGCTVFLATTDSVRLQIGYRTDSLYVDSTGATQTKPAIDSITYDPGWRSLSEAVWYYMAIDVLTAGPGSVSVMPRQTAAAPCS